MTFARFLWWRGDSRRCRSVSTTAMQSQPAIAAGRHAEECAELILAGDRDGLVERALRVSPGIPGAPDDEVRELQRWAHDLFFLHRIDSAPTRIVTPMVC